MKKTRKMLVVGWIVILILSSTVAMAQNTTNKVLKVNLESEPRLMDPQSITSLSEGHIINNVFEGLMREVSGKLEFAMAESYTLSQDKLTYTFKLREGKWSDGEEVTALNFEYAWKRALDPKNAVEYSFLMYPIKGAEEYNKGQGKKEDVAVKAVDKKVLQVTLNKPTPYFLNLITHCIFMPVREDNIEAKSYVGNGPFKIESYDENEKILLKNKNYWNVDKIKVEKIELSIIEDNKQAYEGYKHNEIDVISNIPEAEIPKLKENEELKKAPSNGVYYYTFNTKKEPFNDLRVRKAFSLAINRNEVVQKATMGKQIPATGLIPPNIKDEDGKLFREVAGSYGIDINAAKVKEARRLLQEAGYDEGKNMPEITLLYNTSSGNKGVAESIQQMWKENLNVDVKLINLEWKLFIDAKNKGDFIIARDGWIGDYPDPLTFLELWTSYAGNNYGKWENKEYDTLIETSNLLLGKERFEKLYKAEKMLMDESSIIPIYYFGDMYMVRENILYLEKTGLGYWYFGNVDIK